MISPNTSWRGPVIIARAELASRHDGSSIDRIKVVMWRLTFW